MHKKIKKPAILLILSVYVFGMILAFSGDLIQHLQNIRYQNQIEKIANSETLEFTQTEWKNFSDKHEIHYQNHYYDVISFQQKQTIITAKVVKDSSESKARVTFVTFLKNNKTPISEKKKSTSFSKHVISENKFYCDNKSNFRFELLQNFDGLFSSKTKSFIYLQDKPPC